MVLIACELRMTKRNEPNASVNYEAGRVSPSPQTPKYLKAEEDLHAPKTGAQGLPRWPGTCTQLCFGQVQAQKTKITPD